MKSKTIVFGLMLTVLLSGSSNKPVDQNALKRAASQPNEWLTYGRDYAETHYSPLKQIDASSVNRLGLAWSWETGTTATFEGTPLVADGVIYGTGSWSVVFAVDARTGKEIWRHDPDVDRSFGSHACCGPNNRGVAIYDGMVYVGVLDGRLIAIDQKTGKKIWSVKTTEDDYQSITGAPRVVKGKVIIGNGGAEFGVRGYVSAYDAKTGKLVWRFYVVPGDPSKPFEHPELAAAAKTWHGEWWKMGGGGTPWDAFAYDPAADLPLYRDRQRRAMEPRGPQSRRRRQFVPVFDPRLETGDRQDDLVLPDNAGRRMGFHRDPEYDSCGHPDRRPSAQGHRTGSQERLLCSRPNQR